MILNLALKPFLELLCWTDLLSSKLFWRTHWTPESFEVLYSVVVRRYLHYWSSFGPGKRQGLLSRRNKPWRTWFTSRGLRLCFSSSAVWQDSHSTRGLKLNLWWVANSCGLYHSPIRLMIIHSPCSQAFKLYKLNTWILKQQFFTLEKVRKIIPPPPRQ